MSNAFFTWDPNRLSVHVDKMDQEHQKIISLMNNLYSKNEQKAPKPELAKCIKELFDFTVLHFEHEEKFFSGLAYDQASLHKKIHVDLLSKLNEHAQKFETTGVLTNEFFAFLKMWLSAHIAGIDVKYGAIANKKVA